MTAVSEETRWNAITDAREAYLASAILAAHPEYLISHVRPDGAISAVKTKSVKLKSGDTLDSIARKHNAAAVDIVRLNDLTTYPFIDTSSDALSSGPIIGMALKNDVIRVPGEQGDILFESLTENEKSEKVYYWDIKLDEKYDGTEEMVFADGDIVGLTGPALVAQDVRLRMKRAMGWDADNPQDGFPGVPGSISNDTYLKLYKAKLSQSLRIDPRILRVIISDVGFEENKLRAVVRCELTDGTRIEVRS